MSGVSSVSLANRHGRLDLSHYYISFSYYTRCRFYLGADTHRSLRAAASAPVLPFDRPLHSLSSLVFFHGLPASFLEDVMLAVWLFPPSLLS